MTTATRQSDEEAALLSTAAELAERCRADGERDDHEGCRRRLADSGFRELRAPDGEGPAATVGLSVGVVEELAASVCEAPFVGPLLAQDLARLAGFPAPDESTILLTADLQAVGGDIAWDAGPPVAAGVGLVGGE